VDSLQTLFQAALADMLKAADEEAPLWEEICRLGSNPHAPADPTDLCNRWYEKRQATARLFERQKELARAIREAGGIPRV